MSQYRECKFTAPGFDLSHFNKFSPQRIKATALCAEVGLPLYKILHSIVIGYIDVGTTYDAWFHAQKMVEVLTKLAKNEPVPVMNLVPGRVATPDNITKLENIWSRDYKD